MGVGFVITLMRGSVIQTLLMAAPVLLVAMTIGLLVSIFQATTSIQDQTLTFVPKIIGILVTLGLAGSWMVGSMANYTVRVIQIISQITG